jgi:hypothetical protein
MKPASIAIATLLVAASMSAAGKDLGMFNGEPTPALAMYAAQTAFAADQCVSAGLTADAKGAASFVKYFDRGIQLRLYKKKDEEFVRNLELFLNNYATSWNAASEESHRNFCDGFSGDIAVKNGGFFGWMMPLNYFRNKFSPISEKSAKRQRKYAGIASVVGAVATTAATVSAGQDAVSSAKVGDWTTSNQQMALSRSFNQLGGAFVATAGSVPDGANAATSVLEEKTADGRTRISRCPVVDHFFSFAAPVESSFWAVYQSVSMPCRDLVASDLERVE